MKTTIYELLGMIKDGKAPKKIKYENRILYLEDEAEEYEPTFNYYDKDGNNPLFEGWIGQYLNDEVEILEEEKKIPEKLEKYYDENLEEYVLETYIKGVNYKEIFNSKYDEMIISKLNEVLDYLKSKGE